MDVGALERSHGPLVDLPPSDHGGHRHVAAAQRLSHEHEVRLEPPVLEGEPAAGASQPGLNLVDDEQRAVAPAQLLRGPEVTGGRQRDHATLDRLDDEGGHVLRPQLLLEPVEIAERNPRATRQQRTETLLEELVAHQGQRAERDPVKAAVAREQPGSARGRACELHRRVHRLGARAREEHRVEPIRQAFRQCLRQHAGQRRVMNLDAVHEVRGEGGRESVADIGMVVSKAREPLAGVEVEVGTPGSVVQIRPLRGHVLLVEPEDPKHVDERRVEMAGRQLQRLAGTRRGVRHDAERVGGLLRVSVQWHWRPHHTRAEEAGLGMMGGARLERATSCL